jgi:pimeloyl-ACP methyl ester carboxylesterase
MSQVRWCFHGRWPLNDYGHNLWGREFITLKRRQRSACLARASSAKHDSLPAAMPNFLMASDKPPLVLLHGITMSGNAWQDVVPLLSDHHEVFTPTALGHRGGPPVQRRPATITDVVDAAEHYLDERGLERPHLAGNSLGGLVAIELARRGRAATVCAFSPGGFWSPGDGFQALAMGKISTGSIAWSSRASHPPVHVQVGVGA